MKLSSGAVLFGKYRIERLLGKGGFAQVYLATHLHLRAPRALKVVTRTHGSPGTSRLNRVLARFQMEARLGARLAHAEGIVRVYDYEPNPQNGLYVLVMEYMPGGSLKDRLKKTREGLSVEEVVRIAREAAQGLAALHAEGLVHRDIKPSNILFDARGRAKIADLGIVQMPDHHTRMGTHAHKPHPGTPMYMSPEQENSPAPLTPASDIYSLGLVLFEALTRRHPKTLRPGTRLRQLRPGVPTWLDELLARMLAPNPQDRPWDAEELLAYLESGSFPRSRHVSVPDLPTEMTVTESKDSALTDLHEEAPGEAPKVKSPVPPPPPPPAEVSSPEEAVPTPIRETLPPTPPPPESRPMQARVARTFKVSGPIQALAARGDWVFLGLRQRILVWNTRSNRTSILYGHGGHVTALIPLSSPEGPRFASADDDGRVLIWTYPRDRPVHDYTPTPHGIRALALQPASQGVPLLAGVDTRGHIYLWQGFRPEPVLHFQAGKAEPAALAWVDAEHLLLAEIQGRLTVWRVSPAGARPVRKWRYPTAWTSLDVGVQTTAVLGSESGHVWLVNLKEGRVLSRYQAHQERVAAVGCIGEGFFSVGWDNHVRFWKANRTVWEHILPSTPLSAWPTPQGLWLGCHDGTVLLVVLEE